MLELGLQVVELDGELVGDLSPGLGTLKAGVLAPNAVELCGGVFRDLCLNLFHVVLVEVRGLIVLEDHEVQVFLRREREANEDFERRAGDTT